MISKKSAYPWARSTGHVEVDSKHRQAWQAALTVMISKLSGIEWLSRGATARSASNVARMGSMLLTSHTGCQLRRAFLSAAIATDLNTHVSAPSDTGKGSRECALPARAPIQIHSGRGYTVAGRSMDAKRALFKAVAANLAELGVPETEVKTILIEVPTENWGLRGGYPASELDLGFKIDV